MPFLCMPKCIYSACLPWHRDQASVTCCIKGVNVPLTAAHDMTFQQTQAQSHPGSVSALAPGSPEFDSIKTH